MKIMMVLLLALSFSLYSKEKQTSAVPLKQSPQTFDFSKRQYSLALNLGATTFTGNRGAAYTVDPLSFGATIHYFWHPQLALFGGLISSEHGMQINEKVVLGGPQKELGQVKIKLQRYIAGLKYFVKSSKLGETILGLNPHLIAQMEMWQNQYNFIDRGDLEQENSSSISAAFGMGAEMSFVKSRISIGAQALYHINNFADTYTQDFRPMDEKSKGGYNDLTGSTISALASLALNW